MITTHKFRNRCGVGCHRCQEDLENTCSHVGEDTEYRTCNRTRAEHAEIGEGSTYKPKPKQ